MYVSLHNRSSYSFGSSVIPPAQLAAFAEFHGMPAVALTDLNGLYAAVPFQQACQKAGVKPIFGTELVVVDRQDAGPTQHRQDAGATLRGF